MTKEKVLHMERRTRAGAPARRPLCGNLQAWNPRLTSDATAVSCLKCIQILRAFISAKDPTGSR